MKRIILIGQPNCGKSTLFNSLAGYRAEVSNFPGTTVHFHKSIVHFSGDNIEIVDLPGIYSLTAFDEAEFETRRFLLEEEYDLIINIADASLLSRSLELTIELLNLEKPMVLALNMMDQARKKGINIDVNALEDHFHIPACPMIASRGEGIASLMAKAMNILSTKGYKPPIPLNYSPELETILSEIIKKIPDNFFPHLSKRAIACRILEGDNAFISSYPDIKNVNLEQINSLIDKLGNMRGKKGERIISSERHGLCLDIYESIAVLKPNVGSRGFDPDNILMHPILGYVFAGIIFYLFFYIVFHIGSSIERPVTNFILSSGDRLLSFLNPSLSVKLILDGLFQGIAGGIGIVLPYLIPFLLILGFMEDVGYLPRAAFLMDGIMHKLGLHGKAVIPFLIGYGCNVPAIMATRILESNRDRILTSALSTLIPCSARAVVIYGLVGAYVGPGAALSIFIVNLIIIAIIGNIFSRLYPEVSPGLIIEIPTYKLPRLHNLFWKSWIRMREFVIVAWPILVIGSIMLSVASILGIDKYLNNIFSPFTVLLGLPSAVGVTLIFGVLRKELALLMLAQALGVSLANFNLALTTSQMITFVIFVVFYVPCAATIAVMYKEIGGKATWLSSGFTLLLATLLAVVTRFVLFFFGVV